MEVLSLRFRIAAFLCENLLIEIAVQQKQLQTYKTETFCFIHVLH